MVRRKGPSLSPEFPHSIHKRGGWSEQWDRLSRWYQRVHESRGVDREEFLYAFFQNCASFRDWIHANRSPNVTKVTLEELVRSNTELSVCQDISNGSKHFALNDPKMPREFARAREYVPAPLAGGVSAWSFVILSDGHKYDVVDLADTCYRLWQTFLRDHNLVPRA